LIDTPAAVVDLDRLERNLGRWQAYCDDAGLRNRPHVKTHRCVEIARLQLGLGAHGITCQKLGEAETMVAAGIDDVLIPYNLVGESKLKRLGALMRRAKVAVTVDDAALLPGLAGAAADAGTPLSVLVECDTGQGRAGAQTSADAVELARAVAGASALDFEGFATYPVSPGTTSFLAAAVEGARAAGLEPRTVSAGGTPTMWSAAALTPLIGEYRVGNYAFYDRNSVAAGAADLDDVALTVHATVVSRPTRSRAILDAGSKSLSSDLGPDNTMGLIVEAPASRIVRLNEEHAYVEVADGDSLPLGRRVRIVPNHACVVANLFDELILERGGGVEGAWSVAARGRSR
jgi:D-serine deaminase-like pyridoxal phosphate-dependent protein